MPNRIPLLLALLWPFFTPYAAAQVAGRPTLEIEVTRHRETATWTAVYEFSEPTTRFRFPNNTNLFRQDVWKVQTEGLELVVDEDFEVIRSGAGEPFERVSIEMPTQPKYLNRMHELHVPYTDGAVLLYTGHFDVRIDDGPLLTELTLRGDPSEHIYVHGAAHEAVTLRSDEKDFHTYAYFGTGEPIESEAVVALIDPGLPEWVRSENERILPQLFELYRDRFDFELGARPMVFFAYIDGPTQMSNLSGGALDGMIKMAVEGRGWNTREKRNYDRLLEFIAHESVHLWNRPSGTGAPKSGGAWMHEGSADALAYRALVEIGIIDQAELYLRHERAMQRAAERLVGTSVRESRTPALSKNFYEAGSALALATELALQEVDPSLDLFDFWRILTGESRKTGKSYTQQAYYELADQLAPDSGIGERLQTFVETRHEDPGAAFADLFDPFRSVRVDLDWSTGALTLAPAEADGAK